MSQQNSDQPVLGHIDLLIKEEERLYATKKLTAKDRTRLEAIKVELDQSWDLLRQRRALRDSARTRTRPSSARLKLSKTTSSR